MVYVGMFQSAPLAVASTLSLDQEEEDSMHEKYFLSGNTQGSSGRRSVESTPQVHLNRVRSESGEKSPLKGLLPLRKESRGGRYLTSWRIWRVSPQPKERSRGPSKDNKISSTIVIFKAF